jgi:hypothetical protein
MARIEILNIISTWSSYKYKQARMNYVVQKQLPIYSIYQCVDHVQNITNWRAYDNVIHCLKEILTFNKELDVVSFPEELDDRV